jgi:pyrroline-5-carboxylate reductase
MNITFIGGGNMAAALIGGLLAKGTCRKEDLRVVEISPEARAKLAAKFGVKCFQGPHDTLDRPDDIVVLAVKPQDARTAAQNLARSPDSNLVISIAAGIRLVSLSLWLGRHTRLVRAMPNTPALIGEGITGLYPFFPVRTARDEQDRKDAEKILGAVSKTVWLQHEGQIDAVTAVSGSGPAYVFYFIEAVEQAAKELGLPADVGHELALYTFTGAAKLAASSPDPIGTLRERVTSKGGTTEAALGSMAKDHVKEAIIRAIKAANERGRELGEELGRD